MPDPAEVAAFLTAYIAQCHDQGVNPLPVRELAALVELIAGTDGGLTTDETDQLTDD